MRDNSSVCIIYGTLKYHSILQQGHVVVAPGKDSGILPLLATFICHFLHMTKRNIGSIAQ